MTVQTPNSTSRVCLQRYHEGAAASGEECRCGTFAIGRCARCNLPVCGDHSRLVGKVRLCDEHAKEAQRDEAATAAERARAVEKRSAEARLIQETIDQTLLDLPAKEAFRMLFISNDLTSRQLLNSAVGALQALAPPLVTTIARECLSEVAAPERLGRYAGARGSFVGKTLDSIRTVNVWWLPWLPIKLRTGQLARPAAVKVGLTDRQQWLRYWPGDDGSPPGGRFVELVSEAPVSNPGSYLVVHDLLDRARILADPGDGFEVAWV